MLPTSRPAIFFEYYFAVNDGVDDFCNYKSLNIS